MAGTAAYGTTLAYTGTPDTPIGQIKTISSPALKRDVIDVTTHDSPDGWREFIGGLKDGGEFTVEGEHDDVDAGQAAVIAHLGAANGEEVKAMKMTLADGSSWTFSAICTAYENGADVEDSLKFTASFKVTGKPTFAAAA